MKRCLLHQAQSLITFKSLTKGECKSLHSSQREKRGFRRPGYEHALQSVAQQTKILLNGVTSWLKPVKMRLNAVLQTGNVNRRLPGGLSCWNSSVLNYPINYRAAGWTPCESWMKHWINVHQFVCFLSDLCNRMVEHVFRSDQIWDIPWAKCWGQMCSWYIILWYKCFFLRFTVVHIHC